MATEVFANDATTTVASGGTTAPAPGTVETWTVASSASFPAPAAGQQFHVADQALPSEKIAVTNVSGTTWTVTRGADGSTPAAHTTGFTVVQVVTAGVLGTLAQTAGDLGGTGTSPQVTGTHLAAALPVAQGGTGQATQQAALDALAGAVTANQVLAGNGTHVTLRALAAADLPSVAGIPLAALPAVKIALNGTTFTPKLELASGSTATAHWVYNGAVVATGLTPTVTGPAGAWTVYLYVTDAAGLSALDQVATFNIGYNSNNDSGNYAPASSYNLAAQPVTAVTGTRGMTALQLFLAEQVTGLSGVLDFTGLSQLTNIELFGSTNVTGVLTSGCESLQRLDQEACSLTAGNVNPVRSMYDFRSAAQATGYLTLGALEGPLPNQYHFCTRDQVVYGMPDFTANMPAINQLWVWNCVQAGALKVRSTSLTSLQAYSNWYATADVASQFPRTAASVNGYLDLHSNQLTSVTLTGCPGLQYIDLSSNQLGQSQVNSVLSTVNGFSTSGGTLNLGGNAPPALSSTVAAPAAPTVSTAATGGTVAAGTYLVQVTYVNAAGETTGSSSSSVTTTGSTSTVTVNSPASALSATGWYAYVTQAGGGAGTEKRQQAAGSPTAIGTNLVLTAPPASSGASVPGANTAVYNSDAENLKSRSWTVTTASSGGPAGTKYTYGENVMIRTASGVANFIRGSLSSPVAAGDLLVAAVEGSATPTVYDSAGNTWTVVGPYGTAVYLAYCLSSAAASGGLTVTAYSGNPVNGLAVGRYTPSSAAAFGGAAGSTPSAGGLNAGANSLGDVGVVPAHSLVWGVLFDDSKTVQGYQGPGFQSGSAGTADKFGFTIPGPNLYGGGAILYVLDAANADAALTWYGSGTGATSYAASAYFS